MSLNNHSLRHSFGERIILMLAGLFRFLSSPHDGGFTVGGALEDGGEDPADADLLGLL